MIVRIITIFIAEQRIFILGELSFTTIPAVLSV
jgi:hypothetical protein